MPGFRDHAPRPLLQGGPHSEHRLPPETQGRVLYPRQGTAHARSAGLAWHLQAPLLLWLPPGQGARLHLPADTQLMWLTFSAGEAAHLPRTTGLIRPSRHVLAHLQCLHQDRTRAGAAASRMRALRQALARSPAWSAPVPCCDDHTLNALLHALRSDPADSRSLPELARAFNMSHRTLMRRSREQLGVSLNVWRQQLKLIIALSRLQAGATVEAVALDLGYATSSAFIAMFRRHTGNSPRRFLDLLETDSTAGLH